MVKSILSSLFKPGGLDSWDQSRSRTSLVLRPTFLKCQDFLDGRDQLFFFSVEIFQIETFQSRLWRVKIFDEIVEICQDASRLSRFVETFWVWKWWKVVTDWEISTKKYKNPSTSQSRQTVKKCQNFQILTNFLISIETFWSGHWCRDRIEKSRSRLRYLDCRD